MTGWILLVSDSPFLIETYNDRPTARNKATFAIAAYRIGDFALPVVAHQNQQIAAAALLLAALYKSSQFPHITLFAVNGGTHTSERTRLRRSISTR